MAVILKCKMCGGDLVLTGGSTVAECEYCGTQQTVPTQDNEKKLVQFERAERLRRSCEFDKAAGVYESIVADFRQEAEGYWGLVLCKYGIEYVDDPATGKKVPTCHRSSFESVMEDPNFEQTLENADVLARKIYREEAKHIEEIRKGIIEVSAKEEPYDIFICYKETAADGQRTVDSVLAQDLYDALTEKGYRVFFSRITLEDKLGEAYEPTIFAALNSAKVMLAVGTDYEHFNAVWVRNEWSRFLRLMEQDRSKHLIPCYKGIDAYDIPREFRHLQAQDLGKVGTVQDLLRGIDKLIAVKAATVQVPAGVQSDDVNRIYIYNSAMEDMKSKKVKRAKEAVKKLESLGEWNDAPAQLAKAKKHLKKRKTARAVRRTVIWGILLAIVGFIFIAFWNNLGSYYVDGMDYMEDGRYARAANKFGNALFYTQDGVSAQEMYDDAIRKADAAQAKYEDMTGADGFGRIYFGEGWFREYVENYTLCPGELELTLGNSFSFNNKRYVEAMYLSFTTTKDGGPIVYDMDADELRFVSDYGGQTFTVTVQGDVLRLSDGREFYSGATGIDFVFGKLEQLIASGDYGVSGEMAVFLMEMLESGVLVDESEKAACVARMATNMERIVFSSGWLDPEVFAPLQEVAKYLTGSSAAQEDPALMEQLMRIDQRCDERWANG